MREHETWMPIVGYEGLYEASSIGRVRNIAKRRGTVPNRILKPRITRDGYAKFLLRNSGNDAGFLAHRIVFESHVRILFDGEEVDHIDGNKLNNSVSNLEAVSKAENIARSFKRGRKMAKGERHARSIFSADQVLQIRSRVISGGKQSDIAKEFGCTPTAINCIVKRKTWRHLP